MRNLTVVITVPLPDDLWEAATFLANLHPAIEALEHEMGKIQGAEVSHSFQQSRKPRKGALTPVGAAKKRGRPFKVATPAPEGVANPGNGLTESSLGTWR